jgi:hypothetical protein
VKYSVSLLLSKWASLDSYAIWKRRQVVAIDEAAAELAEDEAPVEISKDSVRLTRKPQTVRPGRATKAVKVNCGVSELSFQNDSEGVDTIFEAVVTSGRLIVSASVRNGEGKAKGKEKGNTERHACRAVPPNEGSRNTPTSEGTEIPPKEIVFHPRAAELVKLFDPILSASHSSLLSNSPDSLRSACEAVGDCDHNFLVKFAIQRAERPVKSPLHVKAICAEALASWRASKILDGAGVPKLTMDQIRAMAAKERAERGKK